MFFIFYNFFVLIIVYIYLVFVKPKYYFSYVVAKKILFCICFLNPLYFHFIWLLKYTINQQHNWNKKKTYLTNKLNWTKVFKLKNRHKITNNITKYLNLKQYNKFFKIQWIWYKLNVVGLNLHKRSICFLNELGCDTWNIILADLILEYLFQCVYERRHDDP